MDKAFIIGGALILLYVYSQSKRGGGFPVAAALPIATKPPLTTAQIMPYINGGGGGGDVSPKDNNGGGELYAVEPGFYDPFDTPFFNNYSGKGNTYREEYPYRPGVVEVA